jgi:iron complex transport system permease protein
MRQPWRVFRPAFAPVSFRLDRRAPAILLLALLATLAIMVVNMGVGDYAISPLDVVKTVLRLPTGDASHAFVVNTLRLPRMLVAALVGAALALSGAILQGLTRNPLADPGILGISNGAGLMAVILIVVVGGVSAAAISLGAFAGAALLAGLVYLLAWRGGDSPLRLILVGIGLGAVTGALITLIITYGDLYDVQRALVWLTGSVYGRTWKQFWALLPWIVVFAPLAFFLARDLNTLNLGEEVAQGLGSRVRVQRGLLILSAVALAGASVAAAGGIAFVGLMAPHIARRLVGPDHNGLLPAAALIGALIIVSSDLVGRTAFAPVELPVGLITAVIGAPFFIFLLWQQRRQQF